MGKTVRKVIGIAGIVGLTVITGFTAAVAAAGLAVNYAAVQTAIGLSLAAISLGFSRSAPSIDTPRQLAANLGIQSDANAIRSIAFGTVGVAGQILFRENLENTGDTPDELLIILGLAGYPATALETFTLNGEEVFSGLSTTGPGAITSGKFANELWVWFRTGEETSQAFPEIAALSPTWAAKLRILRGIPCIGMRVKVTENLAGKLEPLAQIRGAKYYDPRLDSSIPGGSGPQRYDDPTTWEHGNNPKLAELLYLIGGEVNGTRIFGMGKPAAAVDLENFASEANICEEQIGVVGGGSINRYSCDGILVPSSNHRDNLELLLTASAGVMDASEGVYRTFAGAWRASALTFTESDIDGAPTEIELQSDPDADINVIRGSFADPTDGWKVKEYPEYRDAASVAALGENAETLDLPFTTDHRTAQRIAKIRKFRANAAKKFAGNYWLRALSAQPGDIVTQTYSRYSIDAQTFRVDFWSLQATQDVSGARRLVVPMRLVEENQSWFDWDENTEEQSTQTIADLPAQDNRPRLTVLRDQLTFEGPFPPANPQVGWLWLDTDVDIVYRWSGSAWEIYATIATGDGDDAVAVNYTNNSHAVPVTNLGVPTWTGSGGDLFVFEGLTTLTLATNAQGTGHAGLLNGEYRLNIEPVSGNTLTEPAISGAGTTTATLGDWAGTLTTVTVYRITAYVKSLDGTDIAIPVDVTLTPADQGEPGIDGEDALALNYTNQAHAVPVTNTGIETWAGSGGEFFAYEGGTVLTLDQNAQSSGFPVGNGRYRLNIVRISGDVLTEPAISGAGTTTATLADWAGNLTTATVYRLFANIRDSAGDTYTLSLDVTLTPADQGEQGEDGRPGLPGASTLCEYDNCDTNGSSSSPGRYHFITDINDDDSGTFDWATITAPGGIEALSWHKESTGSAFDYSTFYDTVEVGDGVTWYDSAGRWVSFNVTSIPTAPTDMFKVGVEYVSHDEFDGSQDIPSAAGNPVLWRWSRATLPPSSAITPIGADLQYVAVGGPNAEAKYRVDSDGKVYGLAGDQPVTNNFELGTWLNNGDVGTYEVQLSKLSGDDPDSGPALGTWFSLSSDREWRWDHTSPAQSTQFFGTVRWRHAGTQEILGSGALFVRLEKSN